MPRMNARWSGWMQNESRKAKAVKLIQINPSSYCNVFGFYVSPLQRLQLPTEFNNGSSSSHSFNSLPSTSSSSCGDHEPFPNNLL